MELIIDDRQDKLNVSEELIEKIKDIILECLDYEGYDDDYDVSLSFVDNKEIHELNKMYRGIDRATDVLSFPMFEKNEIKEVCKMNMEGQEVLGDVIISIEQVKKQAEEYGHSFERELAYMAVHGFYHLMGYDHMEENEKKEMREKEENILSKLDIKRG